MRRDSVSLPTTPPLATPAPARDSTTKQIRGSSLLLAGRLLSLVLNFGTQVMIVRYLSKTDYGAFAYALSIVALVQNAATLGLDRSITRFVPIYEEREEYGKLFGTIVGVVGTILGLGLAAVILVVGLQGTLGTALIEDEQALSILLVLVALAPIQGLDTLIVGLFAVFAKPRAIFFRRYVLAPGLRLAVVLLLIGFGSGVMFLAGGYVVAGASGIGVYTWMLLRELRKRGLLARFDRAQFQVPAREVLAFTIPLLTTDILYVVMTTTDVLLLGHYRGAVEVADFRVIGPLAVMNQVVMSSFAILFMPLAARLFAREDRDGIGDLYWQTAIWMATLSFPVFAVTFSLAQPVTVLLYGEIYRDSGLFLALLSLGYYFNAALGFNGLTLKVFGRLRYIVSINLAAAAFNVALNLVLIPRYGALGAAIGTAATLLLHNILKQAGLRSTGIDLVDRRYLRIYGVIAAAAGAVLLTQVLASPPVYVGIVLAAAASVAVIGINRSALRIGERFPELAKSRVLRFLAGP